MSPAFTTTAEFAKGSPSRPSIRVAPTMAMTRSGSGAAGGLTSRNPDHCGSAAAKSAGNRCRPKKTPVRNRKPPVYNLVSHRKSVRVRIPVLRLRPAPVAHALAGLRCRRSAPMPASFGSEVAQVQGPCLRQARGPESRLARPRRPARQQRSVSENGANMLWANSRSRTWSGIRGILTVPDGHGLRCGNCKQC